MRGDVHGTKTRGSRLSHTVRAPGFGAVVAAEWARSSTLPHLRAAPLVCALVGAAVATLFLVTAETTTGTRVSDMSAFDVVSTSMLGMDAAAIVVVFLVASFVTAEQSTGLNRVVLLAAPRRGRRLAASALAVAAGALLCGLASGAAAYGVGQSVAALAGGATASPTVEGVARVVGGSVLMAPFYGTVALAFATCTRSLPGGVAGALGLSALPAVLGWFPGKAMDVVSRYLPGELVHAISGLEVAPGAPCPLVALVLLTLWAVFLVGVAHLCTRDRGW